MADSSRSIPWGAHDVGSPDGEGCCGLRRACQRCELGDLQTVFGTRGDTFRCQCQRYEMRPGEAWASTTVQDDLPTILEQDRSGPTEPRPIRWPPIGRCRQPRDGGPIKVILFQDGELVGQVITGRG
jgi:hypothetical protein